MKKVLFPIIMIGLLLLTACGSDGNGGDFNTDNAAENSKDRLKEFFALYENEEELTTLKSEDIKKVIEENMKGFFTESYKEKVDQALNERETEHIDSEYLFFLLEDIKNDKTVFCNDYSIVDYKLEKEEKTIILGLKTNQMSIKDSLLKVEMIIEDGEWKINRVS